MAWGPVWDFLVNDAEETDFVKLVPFFEAHIPEIRRVTMDTLRERGRPVNEAAITAQIAVTLALTVGRYAEDKARFAN